MRNSSSRLIVSVLIAFATGLLLLYLFQSVWLQVIQNMLASSAAYGPSVSTMPVSGVSFPTASAPVRLGVEGFYNQVGITVIRAIVPANQYLWNSAKYSELDNDEEYMLVDITVRCLSSAKESCRLTEFDFGVESSSGRDYYAELSSTYDYRGLFEGGEIEPGKSLSGSLIFVVKKGDSGLVLVYPRMYAFGGEAKFILTR